MTASTKPPAWNQIRADAAAFAARWVNETDENAGAQGFWTEFLTIFGVDRKRVATFEARAQRATTGGRGRIDLFWPGVLAIEHKSAGKDLTAAEQQCLDYLDGLDKNQFPGWVITSDFARIRIRDLGGDNIPYEFPLTDLPKEIDRFGFIAGYTNRKLSKEREHEVDIAAAKLMGTLYEQISETGFSDHEVSIFLVRLLFLLFGDDTGLWERGLFLEFIETRTNSDGSDLGSQLTSLFQTLDRPAEVRSSLLDDLLARFPYVNGGLFADRLDIPSFNKTIRETLLAACHIDWAAIIPAIFGSLFQAIKSREDRRALGEHYTSERNILKVIKPLFLDGLRAEFEKTFHDIRGLQRLHDRLGKMKFLDPACGCGNFLVIAYREMRLLELDILRRLRDLTGQEQLSLDATLGLKVDPSQFHGIEFEEWPARIAEVAMFLVDHQMNLVLAQEFGQAPDRLPISTSAQIANANALQIDWTSVVGEFDSDTYILGNPPWIGSTYQTAEQKKDQKKIWGSTPGGGTVDYVTNWFVLSGEYIANSGAHAALVSTNSITQGGQPPVLWKRLYPLGIGIDFAHRTFSWSNEGGTQAAVHCVIIGFSSTPKRQPLPLWTYPDIKGEPVLESVSEINAYLLDAPLVLVPSRSTPLQTSVQQMVFGSKPADGGHLSNISETEAGEIRETDPIAAKYLRSLIGAAEMLNEGHRWCLWLLDASPTESRSSPILRVRIAAVREMRLASAKESTVRSADRPSLFQEIRQPSSPYLAVPRVSSESRRYVPMAMYEPDVIASDALLFVANADLFTFGLMQSSVFALWNRTVSGRLKSDTRISAEITYNNFPHPEVTDKQREAIEEAMAGVLTAREEFPESSLADLYDPLAMPSSLLAAHRVLDAAVFSAYGLPRDADDLTVLRDLFARYAALEAEGSLFTGVESKPKKRVARKRNP